MVERVQSVVVGAGVVGLAIARRLALSGRQVLVLEAGKALGTGVSARSSEVMHAGLYYAPQSLKARLCVQGRHMLQQYCQERRVPHSLCGKLVVAPLPLPGEGGAEGAGMAQIMALRANALANGLEAGKDVSSMLSQRDITHVEAEVIGAAGFLSHNTGIVDSHSLMCSLQAEAEAAGALFAFEAPVTGGGVVAGGGGWHSVRVGGSDPLEIHCKEVVNAAGLAAVHIAQLLLQPPPLPSSPSSSSSPAFPLKARFAKGRYLSLTGAPTPFNRLIYPLPEPHAAGLGTHATLALDASCRFGPDVLWLPEQLFHHPNQPNPSAAPPTQGGAWLPFPPSDGPLYALPEASNGSGGGRKGGGEGNEEDGLQALQQSFYSSVQRYWPALPSACHLVPAYAGIRPKLTGPGQPAADFVILSHRHPLPPSLMPPGAAAAQPPPVPRKGAVHLLGIESPGLTSCLAIARLVQRRLDEEEEV